MFSLQKRTDVFSDVLETGLVTSVSVDTIHSEKLLRLLDTVVIKLEGGTDEDLKVLDEKPIEHRPLEPIREVIAPVAVPVPVVPVAPAPVEPKPTNAENPIESGDEDEELQQTANVTDETPPKPNDIVELIAESVKRTTSGSSSSSHSSSSSSSSNDEDSHDEEEDENR